MPTPTLYMGLPNPTPFGDSGTWANSLVTCNIGFDTLAVAAVPATVTSTQSLAVFNGMALIEANATGGAIVLTLPDATLTANKGRRYSIVKVDASVNTVTVQGFSGGQLISGAASIVLSTQWFIVNLTSDGAGWIAGDPDTSLPVTVVNGGTGVTSLTLNGVLYGNGTSAVQVTAVGASGTVFTGTGAAPAFSATPTVTSITTTGGTTTLAGTITISGTATYTTANPTFFSSTGSGAVVLATSPTFAGNIHVNRLTYDQGTAYTGSDSAIVQSAGWGPAATITGAVGNDSALQFTVTSDSTGLSANPTITITFKDGTFGIAPLIMAQQTGGTLSANFAIVSATTTATTATITWHSTPQATTGYTFTMFLRGTV